MMTKITSRYRRGSRDGDFDAGGPVPVPVLGLQILSQSFNISSAQLLNINASPVPLLPAPGPGNCYRIITFQWNFIPGSTPYTVVGCTGLQVGNAGLSVTFESVTIPNTGLTNAVGINQQAGNSGGAMTINNTVANVINKSLVLWISGASPAAGNGTAIVTLEYYVVPLQ